MKPLQLIFILEQVGIMPMAWNIKNLNNPFYWRLIFFLNEV